MRVCVVGAGAIGGWIGTRLAASGAAEVSAVARGASLHALREHGWRLHTADGLLTAVARASAVPAELGAQDVVLLTVKTTGLADVAPSISPLLGPDTVVLPFTNGVPWWFGHGTELGDEPLTSLDPGGRIAAAVPLRRILGGVVHAGCTAPEPGVVVHRSGNRLIVGEPAGGTSDRARAVGAALATAGFDAVVSPDVRRDIWYKLWGNLTMNPVSALTGATLDRVLADPLVRAWCSAVMGEAAAIGARLGCPVGETPEDRHAVTASLGAFRTSMLQDVQAGRPLELDALVTAVRELGGRLGIATPNVDALLGVVRLFARTRGLYPADDPAAGPDQHTEGTT